MQFRKAKIEDIDQIIAIAEAQVGYGYLDYSYLYECFHSKKVIIDVVCYRHKVLGFSISKILKSSDQANFLAEKINFPSNFFLEQKTYVYRELTAVDEQAQGRGVASRLISSGIEYFKLKCDYIFCEAWKSSRGVHIHSNLIRNGYKEYIQIKDYWFKDSIDKSYACNICRGACHCTAVIYVVDLNND